MSPRPAQRSHLTARAFGPFSSFFSSVTTGSVFFGANIFPISGIVERSCCIGVAVIVTPPPPTRDCMWIVPYGHAGSQSEQPVQASGSMCTCPRRSRRIAPNLHASMQSGTRQL
jgi:hypothetical protein